MKIFLDWMHRKLHPTSVKYSQVPQKKGEELVGEMVEMAAEEKEALLLRDMLGGILTIGTLGQYQDPFLPIPEEAIRLYEEEEEEDEEDAPLIVAIIEEKEEEDKTTMKLKKQEIIVEEDLPLLKEDKERKERARTTLADLFAADPTAREDANVIKGIKNISNNSNKQSHTSKKKEEKTKKKVTDTTKSFINGKNSKIHKLMRRTLKKKIHPESITSAGAATKSIDKNDDVSKNSLVYW